MCLLVIKFQDSLFSIVSLTSKNPSHPSIIASNPLGLVILLSNNVS